MSYNKTYMYVYMYGYTASKVNLLAMWRLLEKPVFQDVRSGFHEKFDQLLDHNWFSCESVDARDLKTWLKYTSHRKALLVMDSFSAHCTEEILNLSRNSTDIAVIPGGCTSKLQPLDVSLNRPFKSI